MCFCQMNGNQLTFTLKKGWRGSITVDCVGQEKKRITVDWGIPGAPTLQLLSCQFGPRTVIEKQNPTEDGLDVVVDFFYSPDPCGAGSPATIPLVNGTQTNCTETPTTQNAVFHFETPVPGETVQVTIENEDDQQGEDLP